MHMHVRCRTLSVCEVAKFKLTKFLLFGLFCVAVDVPAIVVDSENLRTNIALKCKMCCFLLYFSVVHSVFALFLFFFFCCSHCLIGVVATHKWHVIKFTIQLSLLSYSCGCTQDAVWMNGAKSCAHYFSYNNYSSNNYIYKMCSFWHYRELKLYKS